MAQRASRYQHVAGMSKHSVDYSDDLCIFTYAFISPTSLPVHFWLRSDEEDVVVVRELRFWDRQFITDSAITASIGSKRSDVRSHNLLWLANIVDSSCNLQLPSSQSSQLFLGISSIRVGIGVVMSDLIQTRAVGDL